MVDKKLLATSKAQKSIFFQPVELQFHPGQQLQQEVEVLFPKKQIIRQDLVNKEPDKLLWNVYEEKASTSNVKKSLRQAINERWATDF